MAQSEEGAMPEALLSKRRRGRRIALIIGVIVVIGVVAFVVIGKRRAKAAETQGVKTADVTRGALVQKVSASGIIDAETGAHIHIGAQITGTIKHLYADIGTHVNAGQVIAELAAPDLEANVASAKYAQAQNGEKYQQQLESVGMLHTQYASAFEQASETIHINTAQCNQLQATLATARGALRSAQSALEGAKFSQQAAEANYRSAVAAAKQQPVQTNADILKAKAALSTADANYTQAQKNANQQIATAESALKLAQSNAVLADANLKRQNALVAKGYVAPTTIDSYRNQQEVTVQQVSSAEDSLRITRETVTAGLQSAHDQVEQAKSDLAAAQAETYQNVVKTEAVQNAEAAVENAKASVRQAEIAVESARSNITGDEEQLKAAEGTLRNAKFAQDTALANMTNDKLQQQNVKSAYEAVEQSNEQVKYNAAQLDKSYIRSPITGTVIALTQQEGETVAAGLSAPTLIEVCALDRLEGIVYVDETDISKVKLGQDAMVTVDAYPKTPFHGKVYKIASAATMQQNVVTYQVNVKLDHYPIGSLRPQMTTTTDITITEKLNVVLAPNEAIKQGRGENQVVVLKGGVPEVRSVDVGLTDGTDTEITTGLKEGETVVLAGFDKLGLQGFGSAAEVPGFLKRTPFGTAGGGGKGGR
jgi:RND family efflux transporter MFP subunit